MAHASLWSSYMEIPTITRAYTTACVLTTLAVQVDLISPYDIYFNPTLIVYHGQLWRLLTTFCYFGSISFNFLFNLIFTYRYCRDLEDSSFHGRKSDFILMLSFGAVATIAIAYFANLIFLGHSFTLMLVYVWSRRNPMIRMNFFGLMNFSAPYLPFVILGFGLLLGNSIEIDLIGISVGHIYWFLEDVFPNQPGGWRIFRAPAWMKAMFDDPILMDGNYGPLPEDTPRDTPAGPAPAPVPGAQGQGQGQGDNVVN